MADNPGIDRLNDSVHEMQAFLTDAFNMFLDQDLKKSDILDDMNNTLKAISKALDNKTPEPESNKAIDKVSSKSYNSQNKILTDISNSVKSIYKFLSDKKPENESKKTLESTSKPETESKSTSIPETGNTNDIFVQLATIGTSITSLANGLNLFKNVKSKKFTDFIKDLTNAMTNDGKIKDPKQVTEIYKAMADVLKALGDNIGKIGSGMIIFNIAAMMGGPKLFIKFVDDFFSKDRMKLLDPKKSKEVGEALHSLGTGILKFSVAMALSTPLLIIGIPGALLMVPMIALMGFITSQVGKNKKDINAGARSMETMALGLLFFSGAIFIAGMLQPTDLLMGLAVIALFGVFMLTVMLMNKIGGKNATKEGGEAMVFMGVALITVTIALLITRFIEFEDIMKGVLIMGGMALISIFLGMAKDKAIEGAVAMLFISASLIVAVLGILMTKLVDWDDIGKAGAIIGGLTISAILLGQFAPTALMGAISLIVISAALIVASVGVMLVKDFTWEEIGKSGAIIGGLGAAAILLGLAGPLPILGAVAMLLMGVALVVMAVGVGKLLDLKFTEKDTDRMTGLLGDLALTFGEIGLGSLFILPGTLVGIGMGMALNTIGSGLMKFSNMNIPMDKLGGENGLISQVLNAVIKPFTEIGKTYSGGFLGFGGSTDAEKGITAVKGIGDILCDIAEGVQAFADLKYTDSKGKVVQIPLSDLQENGRIITSIRNVLGAVGIVFAELGAANGETGWFSSGLIEKGVKSIAGVGENLVNIAKAVQEFANLTYTDKNGKKVPLTKEMIGTAKVPGLVGINIRNMISAITGALGEIGKSDDAQGDWWFGTSAINKGKEMIDGVGENIGSLATSAKTIMDIFDKAKPEDLERNIKTVIGAMTKSLANPELLKSGASIEKTSKIVLSSSESIKKLADISVDIYESTSKLKGFDTKFPKSMEAIVLGFKKINLLTGTNVNATKFNQMTAGIVSIANSSVNLEKASLSIEKISTSLIKTFKSINELADDKLKNVKEFFQTIVEIDKFNQEKFDQAMEQQLNNINTTQVQNTKQTSSVKVTTEHEDTSKGKNKISVDQLYELMSQQTQIMQSILAKLSGTLSVDMIDDGVGSLSKYSKKA